ncbi:MAG: SDR family NAD(P)-dependent oxidoreductase [Chloroflexota bacterium]
METLGIDEATVDCTDYEAIQTTLAEFIRNDQPLDGVTHCAGILRTGLFEAVLPADHVRTVNINLTGTLHIGIVAPNLVNTPMLSAENRAHASLTHARSLFRKIYEADDIARVITSSLVYMLSR